MKKVFQVGPDIKLKGGIATVIKNISDSEKLNDVYRIQLISTISDKKIISFIKSILQIRKARKEDIIHFHVASYGSFFRKYILYKILRKDTKQIFHLHGGGFINFYISSNKVIKYFIKDMLNGCDLIINVSNYMLEEMKKEFPSISNKVVKIYNGIDSNINSTGFENKGNTILYFGKLIEYKGIYDFIEVLISLKEFINEKKWNVIIAGDGEVERVNKLILEMQLDSFVSVVGWVAGKEKEEVLNKAKIVVIPSHVESFGIAAIEAMAYGNSIVSTDVGALPEIIKNNENGFVIKKGSIEGIANKIRKLIEDEKLMEKIYRKNTLYWREFTVDEMINNLIRQYELL